MGVTERREREREHRRAAIVAAATEVFAEHGLDGASMASIARHAELGKASLYYYFDTKQALFDAVLSQGMDRFFTELTDRHPPTGDLAAAVEDLLSFTVGFFQRERCLLRLMAPAMSHLHMTTAAPGTAHPGLAALSEGHTAYLTHLDQLVAASPWSDRPHQFLAFLTDVIVTLLHLLLTGGIAEAEARLGFYVDLIRGRTAATPTRSTP